MALASSGWVGLVFDFVYLFNNISTLQVQKLSLRTAGRTVFTAEVSPDDMPTIRALGTSTRSGIKSTPSSKFGPGTHQ